MQKGINNSATQEENKTQLYTFLHHQISSYYLRTSLIFTH